MRPATLPGLFPSLLLAAFAVATLPGAIGAQSQPELVVNTDVDKPDTDPGDGFCDVGDGTCALRAAIEEANAFPGADTITFDAAVDPFVITLDGSQLPAIAEELEITGDGAESTIVQAGTCDPTPTSAMRPVPEGCSAPGFRVLEIAGSASVVLRAITIRHGSCSGACETDPDNGGGILNLGTLSLDRVHVVRNTIGPPGSFGGGLHSEGTVLSIVDSLFHENHAASAGGGLMNRLGSIGSIVRSVFSGNTASYGAGLYNDNGSLDLVAFSTFSGNLAVEGGALYNDGTLTRITASTFQNNEATDFGGAIQNEGSIAGIDGCTFAVNKTGGSGGAIAFSDGDSGTVVNSTFVENSATDDGGGVWVALGATVTAIAHSTFSGHEAAGGSGVASASSTPLTASIVAKGNNSGCSGTADGGGNFDEDGSCGATTPISPDTDYSTTLGDHGGPTLTLELLPGSVAIDAGGACPGVVSGHDQRGAPRDGSCDAGAFEAVADFLFADGFESTTTAAWSAAVP